MTWIILFRACALMVVCIILFTFMWYNEVVIENFPSLTLPKRMGTGQNYSVFGLVDDTNRKGQVGAKLDPRALSTFLTNYSDNSVARQLQTDVRIVCWINTFRANLPTKATAVRDTWGKRCNKLIFFSDDTNDTFPTVGFGTPEGKKYMVPRIFKAFEYIYEHHLQDGDWFLRSDDDAYIVMENLRYLLSTYSTSDPWYIGRPYTIATPQGFNSGGAGFVLSKRALEMLVKRPANVCEDNPPKGGADDMFMGKCLYKLGVKLGDARDRFGKTRFHPSRLYGHLTGHKLLRPVNRVIDKYGHPVGADKISQYFVSFHHIQPEDMHTFEFLLYGARPYGITHGLQDINVQEDPTKDTTLHAEDNMKPRKNTTANVKASKNTTANKKPSKTTTANVKASKNTTANATTLNNSVINVKTNNKADFSVKINDGTATVK